MRGCGRMRGIRGSLRGLLRSSGRERRPSRSRIAPERDARVTLLSIWKKMFEQSYTQVFIQHSIH